MSSLLTRRVSRQVQQAPRTFLLRRTVVNAVPQASISRLFGSSASKSSNNMEKILSKQAAPPAGPYTQAIKAGGVIYCSGQIPANEKGELIEGSIADKTRCCAQNIKAILEEAGSSLDKIVKCNVFLDDMANFAEMNGEYEKWFSHKPARSCVAIKSLPKGVPVEIECIALA